VVELGASASAGSYSNYAVLGDGVVRSSGNLMLQSGTGNAAIYINKTNQVGINTNSLGSYALSVSGTIYATGDVFALSDQRYKENIFPLQNSLTKLNRLTGYSYTRIDEADGRQHIGLLAQELYQVIPEAVEYDSISDKYSVNYGCLVAPIIQSIKELQKKVTEQEAIIQRLLDRSRPE